MNVTPLTLEDLGAIVLPQHPASIVLDDYYGLTLEDVVNSDDTQVALTANLAVLNINSTPIEVADLNQISDYGAGNASGVAELPENVAKREEMFFLKETWIARGSYYDLVFISVLSQIDEVIIYDNNSVVINISTRIVGNQITLTVNRIPDCAFTGSIKLIGK